jgi:hypothetical protein
MAYTYLLFSTLRGSFFWPLGKKPVLRKKPVLKGKRKKTFLFEKMSTKRQKKFANQNPPQNGSFQATLQHGSSVSSNLQNTESIPPTLPDDDCDMDSA